jgi:hypothetical protein
MADADSTLRQGGSMNDGAITLDREAVAAIRRALLIGLSSFGEIERIDNQCGLIKIGGDNVPEGLTPIHPTGSCDTIGEFAAALRYLE